MANALLHGTAFNPRLAGRSARLCSARNSRAVVRAAATKTSEQLGFKTMRKGVKEVRIESLRNISHYQEPPLFLRRNRRRALEPTDPELGDVDDSGLQPSWGPSCEHDLLRVRRCLRAPSSAVRTPRLAVPSLRLLQPQRPDC